MVTVEIAYSVDREYRLVRHAADKTVWFAVEARRGQRVCFTGLDQDRAHGALEACYRDHFIQ